MSMENNVFFAESGMTTTSANHIANLAKEKIQSLEDKLSELSFVETSVKLISSSEKSIISRGDNYDTLNEVNEILEQIAKYKSLIAWLREAIKAKNKLISDMQNLDEREFCKIVGIEYPEYPKSVTHITEEDVIDKLSIKERNRYFHLETLASVYGKAIHPNGSFSYARKKLSKALSHPNDTSGTGRDLVITNRRPTVNISDVEEKFFELQARHREIQAELNGLKHKIELEVFKHNNDADNEYSHNVSAYRKAMLDMESKYKVYVNENVHKLSEYKITVPNDLASTLEEVKKLGK